MTDFVSARRHMVDGQIRTTDVTDLRVISAMLEVAREKFLPPAVTWLAYLDLDVPVGASRRLLKPMVLAKLIQAAELAATDRVLDAGCATGYGAAVLARIAGQVVALEQDGGRLVCVLGSGPGSKAMLYRRSGGEVGGRAIFDATAALLPGFAKTPVFAF